MNHYYAICEPDDAGGFWISFPGRDGITSAAVSAGQIVSQAQDALATVLMYEGTPADLPPSIEDGAMPPVALSDYDQPQEEVIPFQPVAAKEAA